jgi:branched-chain amino acid transport system substrate-binding protein
MRQQAKGWGSVAAVLAVALVAGSGCGTRVPEDRLQRTLGWPGAPPAGQTSPGSPPASAGAAGPIENAAGARPPDPVGARLAGSGSHVALGVGGREPSGQPAPAQGRAPEGAATRPVDATGASRAAGQAKAVASGGPRAEGKPVVIGSVGTLSGPVGAAMQGGPRAVRVWAKALNTGGGLGGRPVEVVVADDGGDPFRYQAILRDLVEHKGVVAFVSNMAAFTLAAGSTYLEEKRVPVIGGDLTSSMWNESPMFFPQSGGEQALVWGMVANGAATGKRRFGSLACRESDGCTHADHYWFDQGWVTQAGMEPAYRARISIAQPDYTAECLTAQRAGVEVLAVVADGATARRVAVSCARQGYRPTLSIAGPAVDERLVGGETASTLDGTLGTVATFPYVLHDTPATEEFHTAMARFGTGEPLSAAASQGWVSAKLFERAAGGPELLTSERILAGLWGLTGETLGGITAPRTFVREGKNPDVRCFSVMKLTTTGWTAPRGSELICPT